MIIPEELMKILRCPVDKGELQELTAENKLECTVCHRQYPVKDGIPVMLPDEATLPGNEKSNSEN